MAGIKKTVSGRVVYKRPIHMFSGSDAIRVMLSVSNNNTGNFVNWRAMFKVSRMNYMDLMADNFDAAPDQTGEKFEKFLQAFDDFVDGAELVLGWVPGAGQILDFVADLYRLVRKRYPVV